MNGHQLAGRVAVVTGGGRGIGAAICAHLAAAGASVAVVDRDGQLAQARAAELAADGYRAVAVELDVSVVGDHDAALDEVECELGPVRILVNNAGVGVHAAFLEVTPEDWDRVHALNARGTFFFAQNAARRMVAHGAGGSIINVTSVVAERVWMPNTAYAASKAAVRTVTEYGAAELGRFGIRVNNLCPGPTDTPLSAPRYLDPEFRKSMLEVLPLGRIGSPDDLGRAAVFLAGDDSSFTTGSTLFVEGGRRVG